MDITTQQFTVIFKKFSKHVQFCDCNKGNSVVINLDKCMARTSKEKQCKFAIHGNTDYCKKHNTSLSKNFKRTNIPNNGRIDCLRPLYHQCWSGSSGSIDSKIYKFIKKHNGDLPHKWSNCKCVLDESNDEEYNDL